MKIVYGISSFIFGLLFITWAVVRIAAYVHFNVQAEGYLKQAADANTIEIASKQLQKVVTYSREHGLTEGYTSIFIKSPSADVGFWYNNINSALNELNSIDKNATQLEKTNVLMKLRETLISGKDENINTPRGLSIFPHNFLYMLWGTISGLLMALSLFMWIREDSYY